MNARRKYRQEIQTSFIAIFVLSNIYFIYMIKDGIEILYFFIWLEHTFLSIFTEGEQELVLTCG